MINMLNRRELLVTFSVEQQANVREALARAGIDYTYKVINRSSASLALSRRANAGPPGDLELAYEYVIYVHKNDYEQANFLMRR